MAEFHAEYRDLILTYIALANIFDVLLALFFVFLAFLLLVHHALWPLLTRTLFRMTDIGTKGRRAILTAVGIALLSTSVFGGKFPGLLKDIAKIPQGGRSKTVNAEPWARTGLCISSKVMMRHRI